MKTCLPFSPQHEENSSVSGIEKYNYYQEILFCHPENLVVILFVSGKFSEMSAWTYKVMKDGCRN